MIVEYLFSSPEGDIPLSPSDLEKPFLLTPETAHPHLTLGDYFRALKAFCLDDRGERIRPALKKDLQDAFDPEEIRKIRIRSEKHGVLYHLASVEVFVADDVTKFALSTALSEEGMRCIRNEHDILKQLNRKSGKSFLPEIYGLGKTVCPTAGGKAVEMITLAAQWFEDYHEWHAAPDETTGKRKISIWDLKRGPRFATTAEASMILAECAKILTYHYDVVTSSRIGAWHHAAGDFIVKRNNQDPPDVKLTTVREYAPLMDVSKEAVDPVVPLTYFFLDMTVIMRLDRLDGVGETVWLDDFAVAATIQGFQNGLQLLETEKRTLNIRTTDFLALLRSFGQREFESVIEPLLPHYETTDSNAAVLTDGRLRDHISALCRALRDFH